MKTRRQYWDDDKDIGNLIEGPHLRAKAKKETHKDDSEDGSVSEENNFGIGETKLFDDEVIEVNSKN